MNHQLCSVKYIIPNGCVNLTARGRFIAELTRFYRTSMLPKRREIMGRLTDDLTDPFRGSTVVVPFKCER